MAPGVCGSCSSLRAPARRGPSARHRRAIDTLDFQEEILFAARPVITSARSRHFVQPKCDSAPRVNASTG